MMMTKGEALIDNLSKIEATLSDYELSMTAWVLKSLVKKLQDPKVTLNTVIRDFIGAPILLEMEIEGRYPDHLMFLEISRRELEDAKKKGSVNKQQSTVWDSIENRADPLDLGNIIIQKVNEEKDPITKTLLQCLNIITLYESGKANYSNYVHHELRTHKVPAKPYADPIIQSALTLYLSHRKRELDNPLITGKYQRCELCRIRDGIAHFRYNISPEGSLHVWDVIPNKDQRVFEEKFTINQLAMMTNKFYDRLILLDGMTYLKIARNIMLGPKANEYIGVHQ